MPGSALDVNTWNASDTAGATGVPKESHSTAIVTKKENVRGFIWQINICQQKPGSLFRILSTKARLSLFFSFVIKTVEIEWRFVH